MLVHRLAATVTVPLLALVIQQAACGSSSGSPDAVRQGFNFQEQWDRALSVAPSFVFVTGWTEWVAGRFDEWAGVGGGAVFPDQYNEEYSRDIEPMRDGHGDDYYYQFMTNVRRYKGARRLPRSSPPRTIAIDGDFASWASVRPIYRDTRGDTMHSTPPAMADCATPTARAAMTSSNLASPGIRMPSSSTRARQHR